MADSTTADKPCTKCGHPGPFLPKTLPDPDPRKGMRVRCATCDRDIVYDTHQWQDDHSGKYICCDCMILTKPVRDMVQGKLPKKPYNLFMEFALNSPDAEKRDYSVRFTGLPKQDAPYTHMIRIPDGARSVLFRMTVQNKEGAFFPNADVGFRARLIRDDGPPSEWGSFREIVAFKDSRTAQSLKFELYEVGMAAGRTYELAWGVETVVDKMELVDRPYIQISFQE